MKGFFQQRNRFFKRRDLQIILLLFLLIIPAEHKEFFSLLEEQTLSFRQILRISQADPQETRFSDNIVLVNTDEAFFKEYKSFPLRRTDIGRIIENITALGGTVVGLDMLIDFASSYDEDPAFADSLKKSNNTVLVSQAEIVDGQFKKMNYPTPTINAVSTTGYSNISSSSALVTSLSRLTLYPDAIKEQDGWPFAVQVLSKHLGVEPKLEDSVLSIGPTINIPLDARNSFYIDFPSLMGNARFLNEIKGITALEFLDISELDEDDREELSYWVKDKIVIIGDTSEVSHDWFDTPVGMVYGVEIIADTIHTLQKNAPLRPASITTEALFSLAFLILLIVLGSLKNLTIRILATLGSFVFYIALVTSLYIYQGFILSMSYTLLAGMLAVLLMGARSYLLEREQKGLVTNAFGRYLSPEVVNALVKDPSKMQLGGDSRVMTAFFSDVAGFSTISEGLTPPGLVALLNEYLTAMCNIIIKHGGTIDKFEGDAIIAFWGAPLKQEDHALRGCLATIDMQNKLIEMRAQWAKEKRPEMLVRIGLNTGQMVVGNMGSAQRMDYTMMGDAVNLAARLEGANKFYNTHTMISKATYDMVKDDVEVRELDTIRVVGKNEPITVYELLQRKGELAEDMIEMVAHYNKALVSYKQRNFSEAKALFNKVLAIAPEDGPSKGYMNRCDDYLITPPADDWDGVYTLTSKG